MGIRGVTDFFEGGGYHRFVDVPSQPRNALLPLPFNRSIPECLWAYPGSPQPRNDLLSPGMNSLGLSKKYPGSPQPRNEFRGYQCRLCDRPGIYWGVVLNCSKARREVPDMSFRPSGIERKGFNI